MYSAENLTKLLGARRDDRQFQALIAQSTSPPVITVDREDDADDEFIEFRDRGISLYFEKSVLLQVALFSQDNDSGFSEYKPSLPMGINFGEQKTALLARLPEPDLSGGGSDGFFGPVPDWVKFEHEAGYSVHVEFDPSTSAVRLVTILVRRG